MLRRLSAGVVSQALNSLGNVVVAVAVAPLLSVRGFAWFGAGQVVLLLVQGVARAYVNEPLLVVPDDARVGQIVSTARSATRWIAGLGAVLAMVAVLVRGWGDAVPALWLAAFGLALGAVLTADRGRYALIAQAHYRPLVALDAVWASMALAGLLAGRLVGGPDGALLAVACWVGGALSGTAFGLSVPGGPSMSAQVRPANDRMLSRERRRRMLVDFLVLGMYFQVASVVLLLAGDEVGAAGLRASSVVFGPVTVAVQGVRAVLQRELVGGRPRAVWHRILVAGWVTAGSVVVGVAAVAGVPERWLRALLGASAGPLRDLLVLSAVVIGCGAVGGLALAGLRALNADHVGQRATWAATIVVLGAALAATTVDSGVGRLVLAAGAVVGPVGRLGALRLVGRSGERADPCSMSS